MSIYKAVFLFLAGLGSVLCVAQRDPADGLITAADDVVRLNQIQTLGTHNSYHIAPDNDVLELLRLLEAKVDLNAVGALNFTHLPLTQQLQDQNVRHLEIDVYNDPNGGLFKSRGVLKAINQDPEAPDLFLQPGYKVLHIQDIDYKSTCATLIDCLTELKQWSTANPGHLPIMVSLEAKADNIPDPLRLGFAVPVPVDYPTLEAEVLSVLDDRLLLPSALSNGTMSLADAVKANGWPTLAQSRGKFMFTLQLHESHQENYTNGDNTLKNRVFFPACKDPGPACVVLMMNDPVSQFDDIKAAVASGWLVRTRADSETWEARAGIGKKRDKALASGAQFVSTDYPAPLNPAQVPDDITTGYAVALSPRCNPVLGNSIGCRATAAKQARITPPDPPPKEFTEDWYAMDGDYADLVVLDDETWKLLADWTSIAGYSVPNTVIEVVREDLLYIQPEYSPNEYVTAMHAMPRVAAPSDFEPDWSYGKGLVWIAVPFGLVAIIFFVATVAHFCTCGCRCRPMKKPLMKRHRTARCIGISLLLGVAVASCTLAIYGDVVLSRGIDEGLTAVENAFESLNEAYGAGSMYQQTYSRVQTALNTITAICSKMLQDSMYQDLTEGLKLLDDTVTEIDDASKEIASKAKDIFRSVGTINTYHKYLVITIMVLVIVLLFAYFISLMLSPGFIRISPRANKIRAQAVRYWQIPSGIVVVTLALALVGLLISLSVAAGDVCMRPDEITLELLPKEGREFMSEYLPCNGTNKVLAELAEQSILLHNASSARPAVRIWANMCPEEVQAEASDQFSVVGEGLTAAVEVLNSIGPLMSCRLVKGTYGALVYDSLCQDVAKGLVLLWIGLGLLSIGFLLALWIFGRAAMTCEPPLDDASMFSGTDSDQFTLEDTKKMDYTVSASQSKDIKTPAFCP